jgi:subfamily B ATP-binding cassette protein MsbA
VDEWQTYRRLLHYARPYLHRLLLGVVFGALFGGSMAGLLYGLKETLAAVFNPADTPFRVVIAVAALLPMAGLVRGVGDYLSTYFVEWVGNRVIMDLRNAAFAHLQDLSLLYYSHSRTGELISRVTNDTSQVERAVSTVLGDLAKQPFALLGALGFLIWLDWKLALIGLLVFPVCIVPVAAFGRRVRRSAREGQEKLADLVSIRQEAISGVRVVKAFGMEEHEKKSFFSQNKSVFHRAMRVTRSKAGVEPFLVTISMVGLALILIYVRWSHMTVDHFFSFAAAMFAMYDPVKKLSKIYMNVQQSSAAADRIFDLLDAPITVREKTGALDVVGAVSGVEFENVSFNYGEKEVLGGIAFRAAAGQCVALVGGSGSGKSTLVSLIPRLFDVMAGRVLVNGVDVRDYKISSLRAQIGIVSQETFLFNDTIANNIAYGRPGASRAEIEQAARRALAHEFILEKEQGYDTLVGDRGVQLSGGQAQRIAIARAILRNPPILILDEATSALDTESERQVQQALDELMAGRTVFAIAHRLSTVAHADAILVLEGGRIAEQGTHAELLARGGLYKYYHDLQFNDAAT